jgi:peptidyl-prolyl cis-trans isomerase C
MLGATLWAQGPGAVTPPAPAASDPVVLSVAGETMTRTQFERLLATLPANVRGQANTPEGKRQLADRLAEMKALAQEARRLGVASKPEIVAQLKLQEENLLAASLYQQLVQTAKPSEADLKAAYESRKSEFEQAKARHILIRFQGSRIPVRKDQKDLTEAEALAKAQELRARILKGEDFAAIAKTDSDDTASGASGGDLGEVTRGRMIPEFENAVFTQPLNQVSEPLKTQFGYHLIQVQERGTLAFDKVKADLEKEKASESAAAQVKALHDKAKIELSDSYFGAPAAPEAAGAKPTPGTPAVKPAVAKPAAATAAKPAVTPTKK